MKLMNLVKNAQYGLILLAVSAQLFTSCTAAKKATTSQKIPKSYGTVGVKSTDNTEARLLYLDIYKSIAIREMERTRIPASIKLAQGLLESDAGRSELSSKYNNHFGIKCHSDWTGERYYKEDDDKDPVTGQLIKSCFRAYKNSEESFIAHSEFLRDPRKVNRYGFLFQLDNKDYVSWANGLERAGYATASDYSEKLIRLIEDLQLNRYDQMSSADLVNGTKPNKPRPSDPFEVPTGNNGGNIGNNNNSNASAGTFEGERNNVRFVKVTAPLTLEQVSGRYDISVKKLKDYNEEVGEANNVLKNGSIVYLQTKRNKFTGEEKYHRVASCETMYDIAQKYGVKLSKLYRKNEMREGDQPQVGEKIILRRGLFQRFDMPSLRDTFGEFRKCQPEEAPMPPTGQLTTGTKPNKPNSDFPFEITPGGQPATSYPQGQPGGYPQSSYPPSSQPNYPNSGSSSYPNSGTTTYPSSNYPNSGSTTYPSSNYPSSNSNNYPTTSTDPVGTITYPNGSTTYPSEQTNSGNANSYPSYPSYPSSSQGNTRPAPRPTPQPSQPQTRPSTPSTPIKPAGAVQYHTVAKSETLWAISRKYGITVDQLKQLNGLPDNNIKIGQQLRVK
jgi:flagellum-specific peptidoglycan hydrolase FlgJ/LysM repeat protein